jgi:hypothetical protein
MLKRYIERFRPDSGLEGSFQRGPTSMADVSGLGLEFFEETEKKTPSSQDSSVAAISKLSDMMATMMTFFQNGGGQRPVEERPIMSKLPFNIPLFGGSEKEDFGNWIEVLESAGKLKSLTRDSDWKEFLFMHMADSARIFYQALNGT